MIDVLDLFSGSGGLATGIKSADRRFRTVRAVENDIDAAASFAANFGDVVFAGPIQEWLRSETVPQVDLVIGGPPCQGFSALGKQSAEDERNDLWLEYAKTLVRSSPRYFVLENVPDFLASDQFRQLERATNDRGLLADYRFEARILNAADFGAAQNRRRAILIGHHRDLPAPGFPRPVLGATRTVRHAWRGVSAAVSATDLPDRRTEFRGRLLKGQYRTSELHVTRRFEPVSIQRFESIPRGGNRFDIPDELLAPCWRNHHTGSGDVMGRLHWDKPSVTIRTEFYKPEKGRYLHPEQNRSITHLEAALLQGFPLKHKWVGSKTSIGRQIGNAVPIPLGRAIGRLLAASFADA